MMKTYIHKIAVFLIAAALMIGLAAPVYATSPGSGELSFEITMDSTSVKKGGTVDVTVSCKNNTSYDITDIAFKFNYDPALINPVSGGYTASPDKAVVSFSGGSAAVSYSSSNAAGYASIVSGQSISVRFKMQAATSITEDTSVSLSVSDATAFSRRDISSASTDGSNLSHVFSFQDLPRMALSISGNSHDADLISIVPIVNNAEIAMSPAFSPDVTEYDVWVSYSIPNFKFTWTKSDSKSSVQYVPTANNTLVVGDNIFRFIVTAEDRTTTKTYTATVHRLEMGQQLPEINNNTQSDPDDFLPDQSGDMDIPEDTSSVTPEDQHDDTDRDNSEGGFGSEFSLKLSTLLILVGAVIALFVLAFTGGYVTHKNASKPPQYTIEDILNAQQAIEMRNRMRAEMMAPMLPAPSEEHDSSVTEYGEEEAGDTYQQDAQYAGYQNYPQTDEYGNPITYPAVDEYGNPLVDEYGNPISYPATDEYGNPIGSYPQLDEYGNPINPTGGYNNY